MLELLIKKIEIIGISESRIISGRNPICDITLPGYYTEQCDTTVHEGGTLLYIAEKFKYKVRKDLTIYKDKELESVFIEITNHKNVIVGCIYRHPPMLLQDFNENYWEGLLNKLSHENKKLVIMGDFNTNLLDFENREVSQFKDSTVGKSLLSLIKMPTRITSHSKTLIDNIFTNDNENYLKSGNLSCSISDHLPQFAMFNSFKPLYPSYKNVIKRDFSRFNEEEFLDDIKTIHFNIQLELQKEDVNKSTNKFLKIIENKLDQHAPFKKVSIRKLRESSKPWITKGIFRSIQIKNKLCKKLGRTKNNVIRLRLEKQHKNFKNMLVNLTRKSKELYF